MFHRFRSFAVVLLTLSIAVHADEISENPTPSAANDDAGVSSAPDLKKLSLEQLMSVDVSTVSRKTESWWSAPGAIDVVTDEDIRRSGAMSIPEALRGISGLQVSEDNSHDWAISARGFDVVAADKMNVQIDGRSLYTPFFSGVQWDAQDTMMEDIEQIEVLRGPGGAVWGNFAVNGFIQIVTKPAWDTQGWLISGGGGTDWPGFISLRYGGQIGANTYYRTYIKYQQFDWTYLPNGPRSTTKSDAVQAGFRSDTRSGNDTTLTLQGDIYTNTGTPVDHPVDQVSGWNLGATWKRVYDVDSDFQVVTYVDHTHHVYGGTFDENRTTLENSTKYRVSEGRQEFQVGFDGEISWDDIVSPDTLSIDPSKRTYVTAGVFGQDTITFVPERWTGTIAAKADYTSFSRLEAEPTARLAYTPNKDLTIWTALSRATRPPVRLDEDLQVQSGSLIVFQGNPDLKPESVVAVELGAREKLTRALAVDVSLFANSYNDLRSYETSPTPTGFPWTFGNTLDARSEGVEVTAFFQPLARLFFKATYRYLDLEISKDAGSRDFQNGIYEDNDARQLGSLTMRTDLGAHFEFDLTTRYQSALPNPSLPAYTATDLRLGWAPNANWDISLVASNIFDPRHAEFASANGSNQEIGRSLMAKLTWRY